MAMTNAERQRRKRKRQSEREESIGERVIHLPMPAGTEAALQRLCKRFGFDDHRELIATMIHRADEAGSDAAEFFAVSRHEYKVSEKVSLLMPLPHGDQECAAAQIPLEVSDGQTADS